MLGVSDASTSRGDDMTLWTDAQLAEIVRSWPDAIVGETVGGVVTAWNRAAERLYGYHADEMLGQRADRLYPPGLRTDEADRLRRLAQGPRPDRCTAERICRDGSAVTVSLRAHLIADHTGATMGYVSLTNAVTPSGDSDARLIHDLRTPLQAIIGFTGTLLMRLPGPLNDEEEHQLQLVAASAQQLLSLINQLPYPGSR
jgi:PAS domain S-box-containing protein